MPLYPKDIDLSRKPKGKDAYQFFVDELKEQVRQLRDQEGISA
jgi:hypothetical protein